MELLDTWKEERLKLYENIGLSRANLTPPQRGG